LLKHIFGGQKNNKKLILLREKWYNTRFEFKWKAEGKIRLPKIFMKKYSSQIKIVDRDDFRDFTILTKQQQ